MVPAEDLNDINWAFVRFNTENSFPKFFMHIFRPCFRSSVKLRNNFK